VIALALVVFRASMALAQAPTPSERVTFDEAIRRAVEKNTTVVAAAIAGQWSSATTVSNIAATAGLKACTTPEGATTNRSAACTTSDSVTAA